MALDELKDDDTSYDIDGFQYVINKEFIEQAKPVKVDFLPTGFKIDSGIELGGSCGGSCGSEEGGSCG